MNIKYTIYYITPFLPGTHFDWHTTEYFSENWNACSNLNVSSKSKNTELSPTTICLIIPEALIRIVELKHSPVSKFKVEYFKLISLLISESKGNFNW